MDVEPYDHLRVAADGASGGGTADGTGDDDSDGTDLAPGGYRVVGVGEGAATLLRVTDADGRRVRSGRVERVDAAAVDSLEPADDPDASPGPVRALASMVDGLVWTLRGGLRWLVP